MCVRVPCVCIWETLALGLGFFMHRLTMWSTYKHGGSKKEEKKTRKRKRQRREKSVWVPKGPEGPVNLRLWPWRSHLRRRGSHCSLLKLSRFLADRGSKWQFVSRLINELWWCCGGSLVPDLLVALARAWSALALLPSLLFWDVFFFSVWKRCSLWLIVN